MKRKQILSEEDQQYLLGTYYLEFKHGNIPIQCPFHEDNKPSASINFDKQVFHCFSCEKGLTLKQLVNEMKKQDEPQNQESNFTQAKSQIQSGIKKTKKFQKKFKNDGTQDKIQQIHKTTFKTQGQLEKISSRVLKERKLSRPLPIKNEVISDHESKFYGYLALESYDGETITGRNLLEITPTQPKYLNLTGEKKPFYISRTNGKLLWLVEGVMDGLTLHKLGIRNVVSANGAAGFGKNADSISYSLRGKTVLIIFDADAAGFKGARKISEKLSEFKVDHAVIDFPPQLGKDINEAFIKNERSLNQFLLNLQDKFEPDDSKYIEK